MTLWFGVWAVEWVPTYSDKTSGRKTEKWSQMESRTQDPATGFQSSAKGQPS